MKSMVYLASPFSDPSPAVRWNRFKAVSEHAAKMMQDGHLVFCPVAHSYPLAVFGNLCGSFKFWGEWNLAMLAKCDEMLILMLPGWELSVGIAHEIVEADRLGIRVGYVRP